MICHVQTMIITGKSAAEYTAGLYSVTTTLVVSCAKSSTRAWTPTVVTDHEITLQIAIKNAWPNASLLLSYLHMKNAIKRILVEQYAAEEGKAAHVVRDIFEEGIPTQNSFEKGLVDCETTEEFDEKLNACEPAWDLLVNKFHGWFVAERRQIFISYLNLPARAAAGFKSDLVTNNVSEVANSMWRKVFPSAEKEVSMEQIVFKIKNRLRQQERELAEVIFGAGPFMFTDDFASIIPPPEAVEKPDECVKFFKKLTGGLPDEDPSRHLHHFADNNIRTMSSFNLNNNDLPCGT